MVKLFNWLRNIFSEPTQAIIKQKFCHWCHRTNCIHPDWEACRDHRFQCEYHPEVKDGSAPSFCHRCSRGWEPSVQWVKPTICKSDPKRYDSRWCLDWICEACDEQDADRKDLEERKYNNTVEAAKLVFTEKNGVFLYENFEPVEADFPLSYESLAPYVTKAIAGALSYHYHGIEFDAIVIRDGRVYTRNDMSEYEVTWSKEEACS